MRKVLCVANQKGGVGKTTTAINLAASLAAAEKKILLIDCDPQGNASSGMGVDKADIRDKNLYDALIGKRGLDEVLIDSVMPNLKIIPADQNLIGVEVEFVSLANRERKLRELVNSLETPFDFILIDCPPSLGFLTINALVASDSVLVPLQCEYFAMEGLGQLLKTVMLIKANFNPKLSIAGILLTMFDSRNRLSHMVAEDVRRHFGEKVFNTVIQRNVRLSESPSHGLPIILYDIKSRGALCYIELAKEILSNGRV